MLARHFFCRGRFNKHRELADIYYQGIPFWSYLQLKHYLDDPACRERFTRAPTVFESLCSNSMWFHCYMLPCLESNTPHCTLTTHSGKLHEDAEIGGASWYRIHLYTHKGSLNVATQTNGYILKTRWYKMPDILHKFVLSVSDLCWRCGIERGTFLHVWWKCSPIQPY